MIGLSSIICLFGLVFSKSFIMWSVCIVLFNVCVWVSGFLIGGRFAFYFSGCLYDYRLASFRLFRQCPLFLPWWSELRSLPFFSLLLTHLIAISYVTFFSFFTLKCTCQLWMIFNCRHASRQATGLLASHYPFYPSSVFYFYVGNTVWEGT